MATRQIKDPESGETISSEPPSRGRLLIAQVFTVVEDVVYGGLGILLTVSAVVSLFNGGQAFWVALRGGAAMQDLVNILDRILLVLMIIELLYTVKVSFREHTLVPEPFLIVGLIAVTRRILIVTAELAVLLERPNEVVFRSAMLELALLTLMVVALAASLLMLRKRSATPIPERPEAEAS
jgi:uncharacterized membrane protein (DUF373 family)